jgi:hypothetical protein
MNDIVLHIPAPVFIVLSVLIVMNTVLTVVLWVIKWKISKLKRGEA